MIYVIESGNYFKVGFTNNWESRKTVYNTHNPDWKTYMRFEGDMNLETGIKRALKKYKHRGEWFNKIENWQIILLKIIQEEVGLQKVLSDKDYMKPESSADLTVVDKLFKKFEDKSELYEEIYLMDRWKISKRKLSVAMENLMKKQRVYCAHTYKGILYCIMNSDFNILDEEYSNINNIQII